MWLPHLAQVKSTLYICLVPSNAIYFLYFLFPKWFLRLINSTYFGNGCCPIFIEKIIPLFRSFVNPIKQVTIQSYRQFLQLYLGEYAHHYGEHGLLLPLEHFVYLKTKLAELELLFVFLHELEEAG